MEEEEGGDGLGVCVCSLQPQRQSVHTCRSLSVLSDVKLFKPKQHTLLLSNYCDYFRAAEQSFVFFCVYFASMTNPDSEM